MAAVRGAAQCVVIVPDALSVAVVDSRVVIPPGEGHDEDEIEADGGQYPEAELFRAPRPHPVIHQIRDGRKHVGVWMTDVHVVKRQARDTVQHKVRVVPHDHHRVVCGRQ